MRDLGRRISLEALIAETERARLEADALRARGFTERQITERWAAKAGVSVAELEAEVLRAFGPCGRHRSVKGG